MPKRLIDPECGGNGSHTGKEVRMLPYTGGNLILCRSCFNREIAYRRERNKNLSKDARFTTPKWKTLNVYYRLPDPVRYATNKKRFVAMYCDYVQEQRQKQFPKELLTGNDNFSDALDRDKAAKFWDKNKEYFRNVSRLEWADESRLPRITLTLKP